MKIKRKRFLKEFCKRNCKGNICESDEKSCAIISVIGETFEVLKKKKETPVIKVNWDMLPKWVKWIAMDKYSSWYGYEDKPFRKFHSTIWYIKKGTYQIVNYALIEKTGKIKWEKSLIKRPVIAGGKE